MTSDALTDSCGLAVSTRSTEAARAYARGVDLLAEAPPDAIALLRHAIDSDPHFELARVALACALAAGGRPPEVSGCGCEPTTCRASTRRERQHIEVIRLVLSGDHDRAAVLGREHLREFPRDALVARILISHGIP